MIFINTVNLVGRLTADTEIKRNSNDLAFTRFTLAVNRKFLNAEGKREADFISCVAWKKTAELIHEHFKKGSEIGIVGRIQTGNYEKEDGSKVYTTDVVVEEITFVGSKKEGRPEPEYAGPTDSQVVQAVMNDEDPFSSFSNEIPLSDSDLPF